MREEISWTTTIKLDSERTPTYPNSPRIFKSLHKSPRFSLGTRGGEF